MHIDSVISRLIPDTRGRMTVETTLSTQQGSTLNPNSQGRTLLRATASVPSGKSTGSREAVELDAALATKNVNEEIAGAITGRNFDSPDDLDAFLIELDGTPNKSRLGANAILSVSIAAMRLSAMQEGIPLWKAIKKRRTSHSGEYAKCNEAKRSPECDAPKLYVNVMNGGVHAGFKLPFQEYMLVIGGETSDALPIAQRAFTKLGELLCKSDLNSSRLSLTCTSDLPMGDEGGYAPAFDTLERPFEMLADLAKEFPNTGIAIDAAASQLFHDGEYKILNESYSADELARVYENLAARFPIVSIEDPFDENAEADFTRLTVAANNKILVVGDDLTCSNPKLIIDAVKNKTVNAVIIKPNQIGTVREAIQAVQAACSAGFKIIASHRSGETDDTFISDFAYGVGAYGIKAGGLGQRERALKYDRLLAIERESKIV